MIKILKTVGIPLYTLFTIALIIIVAVVGKQRYDEEKIRINSASKVSITDYSNFIYVPDNRIHELLDNEYEPEILELITEEPEIVIEPREQYETTTSTEEEITEEVVDKNYGFSYNDIYLLARITMAEVEAASLTCKEYVVATVLNRLYSDVFPNTVEEVIFQTNQFTPTFDGRWERVPIPNDECYEAVYNVIAMDKTPIDSLYFESCNGSSWHSNNLTLLAEEDGMRFYK